MKKRLCLVLDCLCAHDFSDKTADLINLQHYVIKEKRLSEREAIVIFYDVVRVVEALHKVNLNELCSTRRRKASILKNISRCTTPMCLNETMIVQFSEQTVWILQCFVNCLEITSPPPFYHHIWLLISHAPVPLLEKIVVIPMIHKAQHNLFFFPLLFPACRKTLFTETSSWEIWCWTSGKMCSFLFQHSMLVGQ